MVNEKEVTGGGCGDGSGYGRRVMAGRMALIDLIVSNPSLRLQYFVWQ